MPFIQIGGGSKEEPVRRRRRRESNSWIRKASKDESTDELIREQQAQNPVVQAALIKFRTGIDLGPEDIHTKTPEEQFRAQIALEAMKRIGENPDFINDAAQAMIDSWYANDKTYRRFYRKGGRVADEEGTGYVGPGGFSGYDPNDPEAVVGLFKRWEEALGAMGPKSGLDSFVNSQLVNTLVKTILPLILGKGGAQIPQVAGPQMISVVVDGRRVEMTREGYEIFKRQEARLLAASDGHDAPAAPTPTSTPPGNGGTPGASSTPPNEAAPAAVTSAAAPPTAEKKEQAEDAKPAHTAQPVPADEPPIVIESEEMRQNIILLVKGLLDETEKRSPVEFAQFLVDQADEGDTNGIVAVNFLNTITYEQGMGYLKRLKHYENLARYIEKIEAKEEYMRAFIQHIKEITEEK